MINIAVCDDSPEFAELMVQHLKRLCAYNAPSRADLRVEGAFNSASAVIEYLKSNTIDILFLDIDMPGMGGFELAKMLCTAYPDTIIIFVSAYEEFVYSSFEFCPFRFLRKSHLTNELDVTFEKVIEKCIINNEALEFDTTEGELTLRAVDILYFEGEKNYYLINTRQGRVYKCRGTMKVLEQEIKKYDFFRIHSAYIVNLSHIESISSGGFVVMKNSRRLSISSRRMQEFKNAYMEFIRRRISR